MSQLILLQDTPPGTMIYSDIRVTDIDGPKYNRIRAVCEAVSSKFTLFRRGFFFAEKIRLLNK